MSRGFVCACPTEPVANGGASVQCRQLLGRRPCVGLDDARAGARDGCGDAWYWQEEQAMLPVRTPPPLLLAAVDMGVASSLACCCVLLRLYDVQEDGAERVLPDSERCVTTWLFGMNLALSPSSSLTRGNVYVNVGMRIAGSRTCWPTTSVPSMRAICTRRRRQRRRKWTQPLCIASCTRSVSRERGSVHGDSNGCSSYLGVHVVSV